MTTARSVSLAENTLPCSCAYALDTWKYSFTYMFLSNDHRTINAACREHVSRQLKFVSKLFMQVWSIPPVADAATS